MYYLFYLSFASNFIILDVPPPPPKIIPNKPAKITHAQLIKHKNSVLRGFFQLCQDLPQRVRATSKARIYQNYIFDRRKLGFDCHYDSIVERNYSVIDRQYETV